MWNNKGQYIPPMTHEEKEKKELTDKIIQQLSNSKLIVRLNPLHQAAKLTHASKKQDGASSSSTTSKTTRYHPYSDTSPKQPSAPLTPQKRRTVLISHYHDQRGWVDSEINRKTEENGIRKRNLERYGKEPLFQLSLEGMKLLTLDRIKQWKSKKITYEQVNLFFTEYEKFRVFKSEEQMYEANKDYLDQLRDFKEWLEKNDLEVIFTLAKERRKTIFDVRKQKVDERAAKLHELRNLMKEFIPDSHKKDPKVEVKKTTSIPAPSATKTVLFKPFEGAGSTSSTPESLSPETNQQSFRVLQINGKPPAPLSVNSTTNQTSSEISRTNPLDLVNTWLKENPEDQDPYYDKMPPLTWEFRPIPSSHPDPTTSPSWSKSEWQLNYIFEKLMSDSLINMDCIQEEIQLWDEYLQYRQAQGLEADPDGDYDDDYKEYQMKLALLMTPPRVWKEGEYLDIPSSFSPDLSVPAKVEDLSTAKMKAKRDQMHKDMQKDLELVQHLYYATKAREEKDLRDMAVYEWNETFWASYGQELFPQEPVLPLQRYSLVRGVWAH